MNSLNRRLLLAASLVLIVFLGAIGAILDRAFRESTEAGVKERLQAHVYALLASADVDSEGEVHMPDALPESRFSTPASGLYAQILDEDSNLVWRSGSFIDIQIPDMKISKPGEPYFRELKSDADPGFYSLILTVAWETKADKLNLFAFQVLESTKAFNEQVTQYRNNLWGWLIGLAIVLLVAQGSILRWGLLPLRDIAKDVERVKNGDVESLDGEYPVEVKVLTDSVNSYIEHERAQKDRYRNSLSDLAHSLKTPLAVIQSSAQNSSISDEKRVEIEEQVDRMTQIVTHQLHRAGTAGRSALSRSINVGSVVKRLKNSLDKVYASREIKADIRISDEVTFIGDEADLMEILGNLIENAYKWAISRIVITAEMAPEVNDKSTALVFRVEDDGPGIPEDRIQEILKRGVRADQNVPGNGIGLAVVQDILSVYKGSMRIERSELGGVCFSFQI